MNTYQSFIKDFRHFTWFFFSIAALFWAATMWNRNYYCGHFTDGETEIKEPNYALIKERMQAIWRPVSWQRNFGKMGPACSLYDASKKYSCISI